MASVADGIDGPVMLAGHSYGGAVITVAGSSASNVVGLVYVAAFAPDVGESALGLTGRFPGSQLLAALRSATFADVNGAPGLELHIDRAAFRAAAAGTPAPSGRRIAASRTAAASSS